MTAKMAYFPSHYRHTLYVYSDVIECTFLRQSGSMCIMRMMSQHRPLMMGVSPEALAAEAMAITITIMGVSSLNVPLRCSVVLCAARAVV